MAQIEMHEIAAKETRRERLARKRAETAAREAANAARPRDPLVVYDRYLEPTSLRDLWRGTAAFMVCGGPSLNQIDSERLKDRGIVSLGINNVAAHVHCRAMVFSDPPAKFHGGVWLDPTILKFCPKAKVQKRFYDHRIRLKPEGRFQTTGLYPDDCPSIVVFERSAELEPETFLTSPAAHWGVNAAFAEKSGRPHILFTFFLGLRLLHYLGVRTIFLLGADFSGVGYAFSQGRTSKATENNHAHYVQANLVCKELRPVFERTGLRVYNCNQNSGLQAWDYVPFEEAYKVCRGHVPAEPFDLQHWYEKVKGVQVPDGVDPDEWLAKRRAEEAAEAAARRPHRR